MGTSRPFHHTLKALAIGIIGLVAVLSLPVGAAPSERAELVTRGAAPYTETWQQMVERHAQWQGAIAAGLIPAPPETLVMHEHEDENEKLLVADLATDSLPAAFKPQGDGPRGKGAVVPRSPQPISFGFAGISKIDTAALGLSWIPPDTNGAIGPNHFVELVNGAIAIYDRAGTRISAITDQAFFNVVVAGVTYPRSGSYDPRIIYDRRSGRWFAVELEFGVGNANNNLMFAVSRTSDPTGTWDKYMVPIGIPAASGTTYFTDFETLGTDSNGVYFSARFFPSVGNSFVRLFMTRKALLVSATPALDSVYRSGDITDVVGTPHPAHNMDVAAAGDRAWWAASTATALSGLWLRSAIWPATGSPSLQAAVVVASPSFGNPPDAPANGSTTNINTGGIRVQNACILNQRLWASRNVGVNSVGGASGADRCAVEYLVADIAPATPALLQSGREYDGAATGPVHFFYPSVMPTGQGHGVLGFSDSNGSRYVAAATCGRLGSDADGTLQAVTTLQDGLNSYTAVDQYGRNRWGDYSYTSLDPRNNQAVWTIQEYALDTANRWGTYVAKMGGIRPFIISVTGLLIRGYKGIVLQVTGGNFYDPGDEFPDRFAAGIISRVKPAGTTVDSFTLNSPESLTMVVDVDPTAALGDRSIRVANPDGQAAGLTVQVMAETKIAVAPSGGQRGQTITVAPTLTDMGDGSVIPGETLVASLDGVAVGSGVTDALGTTKITFTIPDTAAADPVFTVDYAGSVIYRPSTGSAKFVVNRNTTSLYLSTPTATAAGAYVKLYAYLKRTIDGKVLVGRYVNFTFNGLSAGSVLTNVNGYAETLYLIPAATPVGSVVTGVSFDGDSLDLSCSRSGAATVNGGTPTSIFSNSASGGIGSKVVLYAYLWRTSDHAMLGSRPVWFHVDGVPVGVVNTDANGYARFVYQIPVGTAAGAHPILALFRGDDVFSAAGRTTTLTTSAKWGVSISCGSPYGVVGLPVKLYCYMWRTIDGAIPTGRTITFRVDGVAVGTGTTDSVGYAYFVYTIPVGTTAANHPVTAEFAGDTWFDPGTGSGTLRVAAKDTIGWFLAGPTASRGTAVTLYGYIKSATTGLPIAGRSVTVKVDGALVGSSVSAANGYFGVRYVVPAGMVSGAHPILAEFAGDTAYFAGSRTATLTVP